MTLIQELENVIEQNKNYIANLYNEIKSYEVRIKEIKRQSDQLEEIIDKQK